MSELFRKYHLGHFIGEYRNNLFERIDKLEITDSTNISELAERLKSEFTIFPIIIGEPKPSQPIETTKKMYNPWGQLYNQNVLEITVTIPFEGNHKLFYCMPSRSTIVYLEDNVVIGNTNIKATITLTQFDEKAYFSEVNEIISTVSTNLPAIHDEIKPWNDRLENLIQQALESRKGIVSKKFDFMEKIGLKVNPNSTEYLVPPTITKKAIPTPVTETSKTVAKEKVPILQEEVYIDIREVLYNVGKAIERKPSLYKDKYEEDLRDIFLLFLETRYEAATGVGEAFNKKGKTDILLKYAKDGTNLFVAECKYWKGQKKLTEGIDQLLGYLTHRDTKTALIFFVDQKEITSVVSTIKSEISCHKNYSRHIKNTYEHSINYEFTLPDDSDKKIQVELMLFHFPKI
ncbi:hypothetical protein [Flavobacterium johnsoniae]|uniref:Uncharacterized protein n=1 Tax=Flavobacterium johnsoniae (strain ATCC 17061 / DSM 2064 / JCM 8514 / BCRC 14874 / CCUG 350202 / NBRC 14942 / NCIMB 11054 / UW101) TaxID=376686 RepID=A5FDW0_FLAJ1|nr:hypothetical protein [Flavobacterium johnsoniae]ABQ06609.1 hypothetical protein Fjoh_3595 [Flavobacterium johnsoniae UW101]OXE99846.1 hypothetical protein B0A63_11125 [Flavobacterium johnsoniae UW101]WQG82361.1 hypothetical protein SR927_04420 [Flavobacterium johnsoniae UW101]SHK81193.1 hypothetical protein SAMN05444146_2351 [Flavobacterium johnsoniae]